MKKISKLVLFMMLLLTFLQLNYFTGEEETNFYQLVAMEVPGPQSIDIVRM